MAYLGREAAKAPIVTSDLPNDGVTLAKMTGGTDGQIITYDASGDPVAVGPGTDGQVLTSTGAGSPPAFEAVPSGGKILQIVHGTNTSTGYTGTLFTDVTATAYTGTINKSISASTIKVFWSCTGNVYQNNQYVEGCSLNIFWMRTAPTGAGPFGGANSGAGDIDEGPFMYMSDEAGTRTGYLNMSAVMSSIFQDTSSATGNHTYVAHFRAGKNGVITPYGGITDNGEQIIVMMEVAT